MLASTSRGRPQDPLRSTAYFSFGQKIWLGNRGGLLSSLLRRTPHIIHRKLVGGIDRTHAAYNSEFNLCWPAVSSLSP